MIIKKLYICNNHGGKMKNISSMSTLPNINPNCIERMKNKNTICYKCYSIRELKRYKSLYNLLLKNSDILTSKILIKNEIPLLNELIFRFEAFGDLINEMQFINYINICNINKYTQFTIFSKNLHIIDNVFKQGYKKPKNLIIVASSPKINEICDYSKYDFIDKIFTVFDNDYINKNDIVINCGSKKCIDCQLCYSKNCIRFINEKLK